MNTKALHILIERNRKYLNLILTTVKIVKATGLSGVGGGILILAARVLGWRGDFLIIWPGFILAGVLGGLIWGWFGRLDMMATARWLDEKQQNAEAFSAALMCLERGCTGLWDVSIVERAESLATEKCSFPWPLGYLKKQALITSGLILGVAIIILIWPVMPGRSINSSVTARQIRRDVSGQKSRSPSSVQLTPQAMQELAKQLFPLDAKLAALAEKALESGDVNSLRALMNQAQRSLEERTAERNSPGSQAQQTDEESQHLQMLESYIDYLNNPEGKKTGVDFSNGFNVVSNGNAGKKDSKKASGPDSKGAAPKSGMGEFTYPKDLHNTRFGLTPGKQESGKVQNIIPGQGVDAPGTGTGNQKSDFGEIRARSGSQKLVIVQGKNTPVLEYVLPGKDARVPLSKILPDSRRAAETALARNGVPLEYDDFVGSYFLKISQEMNSPESEGQK